MPHRTFLKFMWPSLLVMFLLIALPIASVAVQSLYVEHEQVVLETENCGPFGCKKTVTVDTEATEKRRIEEPLGRFNGMGTYTNRNHLAFDELSQAWNDIDSSGSFLGKMMNLPFYKALVFTLAYTFIVTPLVIVLGMVVALCVNALPKLVKGPTIFFSLLPMIVTPLIGSLILFWMIDADGVIGATLQRWFDDDGLSLKASPTLTWITIFIYGIWHSIPFSFIVFYAGLQTVPTDTLEASMIDGASRWETIRYVVIPHMAPLVTFVALMQLMDNFRVFEPIVGFASEAHATSLSWLIYNDLRGADSQLFGSAAATSMLTIVGVAILLTPVFIRTWRGFNRKSA
ncbi:ABC transporter permease [Veronia nyctiphanis]|uniref:ABC transporter permease n=1 Tax=Veronia nyctiphanis TaxID=1278244 RepID=A0A4Q0YI48_9GAMM|nr:sugar ABC transporter permease [Veronia nyctiphanis]RXJ69973.1 ABC transporter permease [Veronia nyctiphanis]